MISTHVVKLATEYLDQCTAKNQPATLVGMHWYIDGLNKTIPMLDEVNEALMQRASVYVQRLNGAVVFVSSGSERTITAEDMKRADKQYRKEFAVTLRKLGK